MNNTAATPFAFSRLLTELTGRKVTVVSASDRPSTTGAKACGVFEVVGTTDQVLLKVDLPLLASLGGVLVGLPEALVKQQIAATPLDETLRDAMHEVLNILSAILLRSGRAVLREMHTLPAKTDALSRDFMQRPHPPLRFHATMPGYPAGDITLFSNGS